jgi:hypothetical protein
LSEVLDAESIVELSLGLSGANLVSERKRTATPKIVKTLRGESRQLHPERRSGRNVIAKDKAFEPKAKMAQPW